MIKVENLIYEYPRKLALDNISFTIPKGSITALVGANGAGKTTLLKCLAALIAPFSGKILVNDIDVLKSPRACQHMMGFLPDFFGLYDTLTIEQSLSYFALARKVDANKIPIRVKEVVNLLNLNEKIHEKIGNLSRGMRQRVGIGQAMIHDPSLLLLDEPAAGLDPEARIALKDLFLELNRQGKTLVVSSHILAELDQYASDLLILKDGKIVDHNVSLKGEQNIEKNICIELLEPSENILEILSGINGILSPKIQGNTIIFKFDGNVIEQNLLLKKLIDLNLNLIQFYVKVEGVQEQYIQTISGNTLHV
ncbi:MAG: ABC transporter ATP-binding protein [Desulfobacterales bacterium]|nr:ABC transporter ATP-binding protein [Desulfobacterales bacterium]